MRNINPLEARDELPPGSLWELNFPILNTFCPKHQYSVEADVGQNHNTQTTLLVHEECVTISKKCDDKETWSKTL